MNEKVGERFLELSPPTNKVWLNAFSIRRMIVVVRCRRFLVLSQLTHSFTPIIPIRHRPNKLTLHRNIHSPTHGPPNLSVLSLMLQFYHCLHLGHKQSKRVGLHQSWIPTEATEQSASFACSAQKNQIILADFVKIFSFSDKESRSCCFW